MIHCKSSKNSGTNHAKNSSSLNHKNILQMFAHLSDILLYIYFFFLKKMLEGARSLRLCLVGRKRARKEKFGGKSGGKKNFGLFGKREKGREEKMEEKKGGKNMVGPTPIFSSQK
ncbi:hypothetical protein TorRG33x02_230160 [Trema orientale]|uniref:Transmembrane protein n=1 Tax=Trema orientale TaxID=63057 RepID=A0A2P5E6L3_TREOI|nr:hypothetical protein TorRG33x02_230160 [Trema orientale]